MLPHRGSAEAPPAARLENISAQFMHKARQILH
jgi:hypothetical protein